MRLDTEVCDQWDDRQPNTVIDTHGLALNDHFGDEFQFDYAMKRLADNSVLFETQNDTWRMKNKISVGFRSGVWLIKQFDIPSKGCSALDLCGLSRVWQRVCAQHFLLEFHRRLNSLSICWGIESIECVNKFYSYSLCGNIFFAFCFETLLPTVWR